MPAHLCLTVFLLFALAPSSTAQEKEQTLKFMMPLRADEVIADTAKDRTLIRGGIDWPDGRTTTSVEIECDGKRGSLIVEDRRSITTFAADPDFCNALARSVQRRN